MTLKYTYKLCYKQSKNVICVVEGLNNFPSLLMTLDALNGFQWAGVFQIFEHEVLSIFSSIFQSDLVLLNDPMILPIVRKS